MESAENFLRQSKHSFYMKANKPDTFLALALRKNNHTPKPMRLKLTKDNISNPLKILHKFCRKLITLCKNTNSFDKSCLTTLLSSINLPSLSLSHQETMDKPITILEIQTAIKTLKPRKRPGTDGF